MSTRISKGEVKVNQVAKASLHAFPAYNPTFQSQSHPKTTSPDFSDDIVALKNDAVNLHGKISTLIASSDDQAIQFSKLGFKTFEESSSWFDTHCIPMTSLGW